jgi:hypothetical protein
MAVSTQAWSELEGNRWKWTLAGLFLAATLSHLPALANQLALDDGFILANPALASLRESLTSAWWYNANHLYRPLTLASFALERRFTGGVDAAELHAVNVILHGAVTLMLALLLTRWTSRFAAAIGALCFAVAPVHAEAVASVVGRAELLCALFLVVLLLVVTDDAGFTPARRWFALLLSAAAIASKEGGVVAPMLAFVAAYSRPAQRSHAIRWALAAALGTSVMLAARFTVLGTLGGDLANPVFRSMDAIDRIEVALLVLVRTTRTLVLPIPPSLDYVPSIGTLTHPPLFPVLNGVLILLGAFVVMVHFFTRPGAISLGVWITAATLAPTSNLLFASGVVSSGRTLYAPAMGLAFVIAGALTMLRVTWAGVALRAAVAGSVAVAIPMTLHECSVWRSSDAVIAEMQRRHKNDYRSYLHQAYIARDHGRDGEALRHFRDAVTRFPDDPEMLTDAATVALRVHDTTTALAWLEHAVEVSPRAARGRTRLVSILIEQGDTATAEQLLEDGLTVESNMQAWAEELRELRAKELSH